MLGVVWKSGLVLSGWRVGCGDLGVEVNIFGLVSRLL